VFWCIARDKALCTRGALCTGVQSMAQLGPLTTPHLNGLYGLCCLYVKLLLCGLVYYCATTPIITVSHCVLCCVVLCVVCNMVCHRMLILARAIKYYYVVL